MPHMMQSQGHQPKTLRRRSRPFPSDLALDGVLSGVAEPCALRVQSYFLEPSSVIILRVVFEASVVGPVPVVPKYAIK